MPRLGKIGKSKIRTGVTCYGINTGVIMTESKHRVGDDNGDYTPSRPGRIVTWTLNSKHLIGEAFDFVIMNNGKCDWSMSNREAWDTAIEVGKCLGLSQVVDSKGRVKEFSHLQIG
jgi:hypothetical protein